MSKKYNAIFVLVGFLVCGFAWAKDYVPFVKVSPKIPGVMTGYEKSVLFFFRFDCKYSREWSEKIDLWQLSLPKEIDFFWIPVTGAQSESDLIVARGYYAAVLAGGHGGGLRMRKAMMEWFAQGKHRNIDDIDMMQIADHAGFNGPSFLKKMDSRDIKQSVYQSIRLSAGYGIDSVPTIVVGEFATTPDLFPAESKDQVLPVLSGLVSRLVE